MKQIIKAIFYYKNHFQILKLAYQTWIFINFSAVNDYYIWKGNFIWHLKKFVWDKHFQNLKLGCQIWTFVRLSIVDDWYNLKNVLKGVCMHQVWRKSLESFLRYSLWISFSVYPAPLLVLWFCQNWKYYLYIYLLSCIKFGVSIFISFWDVNYQIFLHTVTHTYALTNFQKLLFWTQGTSKQINQVKTWY